METKTPVISTKRHTTAHHKGVPKTGNPYLDLWVYVWQDAFELADSGDAKSKAELIEYFGSPLLFNLYIRGLINWDPSCVTMQPMLKVA